MVLARSTGRRESVEQRFASVDRGTASRSRRTTSRSRRTTSRDRSTKPHRPKRLAIRIAAGEPDPRRNAVTQVNRTSSTAIGVSRLGARSIQRCRHSTAGGPSTPTRQIDLRRSTSDTPSTHGADDTANRSLALHASVVHRPVPPGLEPSTTVARIPVCPSQFATVGHDRRTAASLGAAVVVQRFSIQASRTRERFLGQPGSNLPGPLARLPSQQ